MAPLKTKGDLAEVMVAADLLRRGYKIAFPYGEDWDYDLILCRVGGLERIQVKYTHSREGVVVVRCSSHSLTNGRVRSTKRYTPMMIDWLAVYDRGTDRCYYVPASELGRSKLHLRVAKPRKPRSRGVRWATDYLDI